MSTARLLTAPVAGAVAIIEIRGDATEACAAIGGTIPPVGAVRLAHCPGIDDMLLARPSEDRLLIMPHGGMQIVEATLAQLAASGVHPVTSEDACQEDEGDVEQRVMADLRAAPSRTALDLLLAQPARWRRFDSTWTELDEARSARLRRLLEPPRVAVVGRPNIGKSTLLNALVGRCRAVVADAPGTTRDWVGARVDLGGLVVDWIDTPGLRCTTDAVEAASIEQARQVISQADLLIAAADPTSGWPELSRAPGLRLGLRSDLGPIDGANISCAALQGKGLEAVVSTVRSWLIPADDVTCTRPWRWRRFGPVPGRTAGQSPMDAYPQST